MANKNKKISYVFGQGQKKATLNSGDEFIYGVHYWQEINLSEDGAILHIRTPKVVMPENDFEAMSLLLRANDKNMDNTFTVALLSPECHFMDNLISFLTRCIKRSYILNEEYLSKIASGVIYVLIHFYQDKGQYFYSSFINSYKERKNAIEKEYSNDTNILSGLNLFDAIVKAVQENICFESKPACS